MNHLLTGVDGSKDVFKKYHRELRMKELKEIKRVCTIEKIIKRMKDDLWIYRRKK